MDAPDLGIAGIVDPVEIGRGGFGIVYAAWQPALERKVAVKTLLSRDLSDMAEERFLREARALGRVSSHPNIVTIFDVGIALGHPYLLMQCLETGSLASRLTESGPLPVPEVIACGIKLAGALETAHRASILHRDVKPENILVSDYGEPELADFGIARVSGGFETTTGRITASLHHAAPELLEGRPPSAQSDVYSLASTLYTLLAGRPPFVAGEDEAIVALYLRIVSAPVPDLSAMGVPASLGAALGAGLAKDPAHRPGSAAAFGQSLQAVQRELGLTETPLPIRATEGPVATVDAPPHDLDPVPTGPTGPTRPTVPPGGPTAIDVTSTSASAAATVDQSTAPFAATESYDPAPTVERAPVRRERRRRGRAVVAAGVAVAALGASAFVLTRALGDDKAERDLAAQASGLPVEPSCPVFPPSSAWNTPIDDAGVHPDSETWISSITAGLATNGKEPKLQPSFGRTSGQPFSVIPESAESIDTVEVVFNGLGDRDESDLAPFPLPPGVQTTREGQAVVVDDRDCSLHEVMSPLTPEKPWTDAYASAVWDLESDALRTDGFTAADQAGLPLFAGMARASELAEDGGDGQIEHALRFESPAARNAFMHPATKASGRTETSEALPPYGSRLRLKAGVDCSALDGSVQRICTTLKRYGMLLGQRGVHFALYGAPDPRWPTDEILVADLGALSVSDFEFVDTGEALHPGS